MTAPTTEMRKFDLDPRLIAAIKAFFEMLFDKKLTGVADIEIDLDNGHGNAYVRYRHE